MNERCEQIAKKAKSKVWQSGAGIVNDTAFEIIAKMIIEECVRFLDENSDYTNADNVWQPISKDLLEHFGVK